MDICSGGGVANDYCHLFAKVENQPADSAVTISQKSLVKITKSELDTIRKASNYGLASLIVDDSWIYQINENGGDSVFNGIFGKLNQKTDAPYLVCSVHTKEAWEKYQASAKPETDPTEGPTSGTDIPID